MLEDILFERVESLKYGSFPTEVVERVMTLFLHNLAVGIQGANSPWAGVLLDAHKTGGSYSLLGEHKRLSTIFTATEYNATVMASSVCEDFCGPLHLGPVLMSSLMAIGERENLEFPRLIEAIVAGYEAGILVNRVVGASFSKLGVRTTPIIGAIAACYAIGKLLHVNKREIAALLSLPCSTLLMRSYPLGNGNDEWIYQVGLAARNVIQSLHTYSRLVAPSDHPLTSLSNVLAEKEVLPVDGYQILNVGLKRQPVNIYVQSAVEAAGQLAGKINPDDIRHITVTIASDIPISESLLKNTHFTYPLQSVLSIPVGVAFGLSRPGFLFQDLQSANDGFIQELATKVEVATDQSLIGLDCKVDIETLSGTNTVSVGNQNYFPRFGEEKIWLQKKGWFLAVSKDRWGRQLLDYVGNQSMSWR